MARSPRVSSGAWHRARKSWSGIVFDIAGSALESDFVPKLNQGFAYGAEIFQVTIASQTMDNLPLMAFEAWMEDLHQHKGAVCVVPAGNNDSRVPCWPAAFPRMISVGALSTDWCSRAYFSNYGGWVDVYAPGQNLVNAFATGSYTCEVTPFAGEVRTFTDMAQWSGTSFSTPIVTGLIAARMARCGESGQEAAAALLAKARAQAIPGVGPVLLPCCDDDDDQRHGERCGHGCARRSRLRRSRLVAATVVVVTAAAAATVAVVTGGTATDRADLRVAVDAARAGTGEIGPSAARLLRAASLASTRARRWPTARHRKHGHPQPRTDLVSVISRVYVSDRDAGPSVQASESAGFGGEPADSRPIAIA